MTVPAVGREVVLDVTDVLVRYATGIDRRSYVDALVMGPDNRNGVRAAGYYDDELVQTVGGWKIARPRFTPVVQQPVVAGSPLD